MLYDLLYMNAAATKAKIKLKIKKNTSQEVPKYYIIKM